ncbi:MAG: hypothetical protein FWD61_07475 [Phycisphaerales bacterium]|nr:hypothetical protein [Phycisphaerales bacterium]
MKLTLSPSPLLCHLVTLSLLLVITGCTATTPIAALSPEAQRVSQSLDFWPSIPADGPSLKRSFFTTIHIAGRRTTASGILDYHNPRDFRIIVVTEVGNVLFDARINWAGVTVLRTMPGLDASIVAILVNDLSRAMQLPDSLDGLVLARDQFILRRTGSDTFRYTWTFDAVTGRLKTTEIAMGAFDTLRIEYLRYDSRGWPEEITLIRKARFYNITFTFTDEMKEARSQ